MFQLWLLGVLQLAFGSLWHVFIMAFCLFSEVFFVLFCFQLLLISCHFEILQIFSISSPVQQSFLQEVWFLLLENSIRNQNLGTGCACCYWGVIASRPLSWQNKEIYVCVLTWVFTCTGSRLNQARTNSKVSHQITRSNPLAVGHSDLFPCSNRGKPGSRHLPSTYGFRWMFPS